MLVIPRPINERSARGMKSTCSGSRAGRPRRGHAEATVAGRTKRLGAVTTAAPVGVVASIGRVHVQVVARVESPRTDTSIVTSGALIFGVTVGTEGGVSGGHLAMMLREAWTMVSARPSWRGEGPRARELGSHLAADVAQVTGNARAFGLALGRTSQAVTAQTCLHLGQDWRGAVPA
jgi:hypothetical protein